MTSVAFYAILKAMTEVEIKALLPNQVLNDDQIRGLHVRCLPTGNKSFLLYYRARGGLQRRPKLGSYPALSLADARAAAKVILAEVAKGLDPKNKWDETKAELNLNQLFDKALAEYWDNERFILSGWYREVKYNYQNHIKPEFGGMKLSNITPVHIRRWHKKFLETRPYAGNRSLEVLCRLFNFAEEEGLRPMGQNPCSLVNAHKEKQRERRAHNLEIKHIVQILDREQASYPREVAFIYTLMFSGARPRAIERARKEELTRIEYKGLEYGLLTLKGKSSEQTGQDEKILIPNNVLLMIDALPEHNGEKLFGIRMPSGFWNRVKKEAKAPDLWVRDWRRTFASIALSEGVTANVLGEALNHKDYQTTKIYARLANESRIGAIQTIADSYKKLLGGG